MENSTSASIDIVPLLFQLKHSNAAQHAPDALTKADTMNPALYSFGDFVTLCSSCGSTYPRRTSQLLQKLLLGRTPFFILAQKFNCRDCEHYLSKRLRMYECSIKEEDCLLQRCNCGVTGHSSLKKREVPIRKGSGLVNTEALMSLLGIRTGKASEYTSKPWIFSLTSTRNSSRIASTTNLPKPKVGLSLPESTPRRARADERVTATFSFSPTLCASSSVLRTRTRKSSHSLSRIGWFLFCDERMAL